MSRASSRQRVYGESVWRPHQNSPFRKMLHPFIAHHTPGFTCDLSGKTDLETVFQLGILDENGLAESRRWSDILNNQNKQDDVQLTGDEDRLSKLSVVFLYYNKSRLGPYSRITGTSSRFAAFSVTWTAGGRRHCKIKKANCGPNWNCASGGFWTIHQ